MELRTDTRWAFVGGEGEILRPRSSCDSSMALMIGMPRPSDERRSRLVEDGREGGGNDGG